MNDDQQPDGTPAIRGAPLCNGCGASNHLGASDCWLCGAALPGPRVEQIASIPAVPEPSRRRRRRPRVRIATLMIAIGVLAVLLAVGRGEAGVGLGLAMIVGPAVGYFLARVARIEGGLDEPSAAERTLGTVAMTVLSVTAAIAVAAVLAVLGYALVVRLLGPP